MAQVIKILIIEDNIQYTNSLKQMIEISDNMEFVKNFTSAEAYLDSVSDAYKMVDVVILDLHLKQKSGLQVIPILRQRIAESNILVLTQNADYHTTLEAIRLGVSGYLLKDSPIVSIRQAIFEVREGSSVIDPQLSRIVLKALGGASDLDGKNLLTAREQQVLKLMAMGYLKKEVADRMSISYRTVAQYTESIYKKLQVPNIAAAVAAAIRKGLI